MALMEPRWVDTHAHVDRYSPVERVALLERAREAGVLVVAVGVDVASSRVALNTAGLAGVVAGVHPLRASEWDAAGPGELAGAPGVVGIGECGFDGAGPEWAVQAGAFRGQCELARAVGLPLVLHIDGPGAWEALMEHGDALDGLTVVRHYFAGGREQADWHAGRGHFLSFGRPLPRRAELQAICRGYPPERILAETDSYPLGGRTTEPRDVVAIGEMVGRLRGWTGEEARRRLWENSLRAFPGIGG
ncbi:MAG: hypothetical protein AMXMBFR80_05420 [Dehalococcoidia bacterium]